MTKWQICLHKGKLQSKKATDLRVCEIFWKIINMYLDLYFVLIFLQLLRMNDVLLMPLKICFLEWTMRFNYCWYLELLRPEHGRSLDCWKRIKINICKMSVSRKHWKPFPPGLHVAEDTQGNPGDSWMWWEWRCLGVAVDTTQMTYKESLRSQQMAAEPWSCPSFLNHFYFGKCHTSPFKSTF